MTPEQRNTDRARARDVCGLISGWTASQKIDRLAVEFAAVRAEATREATDTASKALAHYPWLPCPICHGVEGCDHVVPERMRAHIESRALAAAPAAREEGE